MTAGNSDTSLSRLRLPPPHRVLIHPVDEIFGPQKISPLRGDFLILNTVEMVKIYIEKRRRRKFLAFEHSKMEFSFTKSLNKLKILYPFPENPQKWI